MNWWVDIGTWETLDDEKNDLVFKIYSFYMLQSLKSRFFLFISISWNQNFVSKILAYLPQEYNIVIKRNSW